MADRSRLGRIGWGEAILFVVCWLAILGWLSGIASGAEGLPAIEGPEQVDIKAIAWLSIVGVDANNAAFLPSAEVQSGPPHIQPGHALFWASKPGTYVVQAVAVQINWDDRTWSFLALSHTVTVGTPDPDPDPDPDPPPTHITHFMVIHESEAKSNTLSDEDDLKKATVLGTKAWKDRLETAGIQWQVIDKDEAYEEFPSYAAAAEKLGFPAVVLRSDEATWVEPLPLTLEGMDELIGRYVE